MIEICRNDNGKINISKNVVKQVAGKAVSECYGVVGMVSGSFSNTFKELFSSGGFGKGIDIEIVENDVTIDIHVVLVYGGKVDAIAHNILDQVDYSLGQFIPGIKVAINVLVDDIAVII